jgi:predicted AAA+ superfamily ATPase
MLDELISIHNEVMATVPATVVRYLKDQINWNERGICIYGDRGVGKTTLLCQVLLEKYQSVQRALYLSADNIYVIAHGLFAIARDYFAHGGQALFIDEVHKYPDWSREIKNILDTYRDRQVIFSGSSTLDLKHSKADLSRRVVYHRLIGFSFREYLKTEASLNVSAVSFDEILSQHLQIAEQFRGKTILKYFQDYLAHGYYPFYLEGLDHYLSKINNIVEKIIFEDLAVVYHLKQASLTHLKRILWLIATAGCFIPNIDSISKNLGISREMVYDCLEYLYQSGLVQNLYPQAVGMKLVRKPGKIVLNNTNLFHALCGDLKMKTDLGSVRETFFINQVGSQEKIRLHDKADFLVNDRILIEVGGRGKTNQQIKDQTEAFLAVDHIEMGFGKKVPLYVFGLLY